MPLSGSAAPSAEYQHAAYASAKDGGSMWELARNRRTIRRRLHRQPSTASFSPVRTVRSVIPQMRPSPFFSSFCFCAQWDFQLAHLICSWLTYVNIGQEPGVRLTAPARDHGLPFWSLFQSVVLSVASWRRRIWRRQGKISPRQRQRFVYTCARVSWGGGNILPVQIGT